jgi:predicted nucleotidyltransferase
VNLDDLPRGVLDRITDRVGTAIGLLVFGSYACGTATPSSDLDVFAVFEDRRPELGYRTWFIDDLHVSLGLVHIDDLVAARGRPADWSLKLAVEMAGRWVWAEPPARAALGDPPGLSRPPGDPELEDFVEFCAKALRAGDDLELRVAARGMGEEAPALLLELNGSPSVGSRVDAVRTAARFRVAPDGWSDDILTLLGYGGGDVRAAVERAGRGVLALLRERGSGVGEDQPELNRYLRDGTLERHLFG